MTSHQPTYVQGVSLLTPPHTNADENRNRQMAKPVMKKTVSKKSPSSSHTIGDSPVSDGTPANPTNPTPASKPKRVRTGCLTCRERHLKCDEGTPVCQNCKKSNRDCKRGVRLNFIDTQCQAPPFLLPLSHDWHISFQDESIEIASEYRGGRAKYLTVKKEDFEMPSEMNYDYSSTMAAPTMSHQQLPQVAGGYAAYAEPASAIYPDSTSDSYQTSSHPAATTPYSESHQPVRRPYEQSYSIQPPEKQSPPYMDSPDEVLYMQVFVEEVGLWMDSMDSEKHFSRLLPFQALHQPMLKHAFLACGVRHLTLVNSAYPDEKALNYYNTATQLLLKSLQNPDRDSVLCATTATILNVYEVMSEKALQRMNHIAGARALIKECRWNATTAGIGGACFWLNVGLELFSCLHFNWGIAWDPDTWGVDMAMVPQQYGGNEEDWCHKILYILAKITNFRASIPQFQEQTLHAEHMRLQSRSQLWTNLKENCDRWNECIPPTMHPMAHLPPYQTASKSAFPEVWIIKRSTIVARLFYHTAMALLGAMHPLASMDQSLASEMGETKLYHSRQICGIVAHVKDRQGKLGPSLVNHLTSSRGVASASIRCLAIAGEFLTIRREQEEVIEIFEKIKKETGWRVTFIHDHLKEKWGWNSQDYNMMNGNAGGVSSFFPQGGVPTMPPIPPQPPRPKMPSGITNPLYKNADFSAENPPYQGSYVAPAPGHVLHSTHLYGFSSLGQI